MNRLQILTQSLSPIINKTLTSVSWEQIYNSQKDNDQTIVSKPYSKSSIAYVCISTTAEAIAQVPLLVMKKTGSPDQGMRRRSLLKADDNFYFVQKNRQLEPTVVIERSKSGSLVQWEPVLENHPWQALFNRPNYLLSLSAFTEAIVSYYMLHGNVWIIGMPVSSRVIPDSIWVAQKNTMLPKKDKAGHLVAWEYKPQGFNMYSSESDLGKMTIAREDRICHIKSFNPDDPIIGMSPFEPGKTPLKSDWKAAQYNDKVMDNDGTPGGAVSTDRQMQPEQVRQFRQEWKEAHAGVDNAHNLAILHSGLKYQSIGVTQKDMEYMDFRKYTRDEIIQLLKMKKAVISITEDLNYATHVGQIKAWWQTANIPLIKKIENALSYDFLKNEPNTKVMYDLSVVEALREDFKEKTEIAQKYWAMGVSFDTINERLELGFDQIPGGDTGYLPFSLTPVGMAYEEPEEPIEEPKQLLSLPDLSHYISVSIPEREKHWERQAEGIWKQVSNRVSSVEAPYTKKIQKVFFEMRKNILAVFNTGKPQKSKIIVAKRETVDAINDVNQYNATIEKALIEKYSLGYYDIVITQGIDTIISQLGEGQRIQITDPFIASYLSTKKTKIKSVIDTIKSNLIVQLHAGANAGEDVVKLEKRIKQVFGVADKRAHVIARTEMGGAMNFGRYAQIQQSSFKKKIWFTALDERVRGADETEKIIYNHAAMHGQKLLISPTSQWNVNGDMLDYPGDYKGQAGNIIDCRCIEIVDTEEI
jgi:HK97 family phage portal protein